MLTWLVLTTAARALQLDPLACPPIGGDVVPVGWVTVDADALTFTDGVTAWTGVLEGEVAVFTFAALLVVARRRRPGAR